MVQLNAQTTCKVLFYNTENLFDAENDSITDDEEYLPEGSRKWSSSRYHKKLDAVARVIIASCEWEMPDVVGLCEVENRNVVYDLTHRGMLADAGYSFIHYDSPDARGIDICMLYKEKKVKIISHESWKPASHDTSAYKLRDILFVRTMVGTDTIDFIFCHWPSRRDGVLASSERRERVAECIGTKADSIKRHSGGSETVIVMGDLNASPDDEIVREMAAKGNLANLTTVLHQQGKGTYRFRGVWEMIDQALISESNALKKVHDNDDCTTEVSVISPDFLLEDDPGYPGRRPFSTYREYRWRGGYSDHLPLLLTLCL